MPRTIANSRDTAAREAELLSAALAEIRENGFEGMTIDAVAARARASKTTYYRRWPTKAELTVAAFTAAVDVPDAAGDTGSLRGDLLLILNALIRELEQLGDVIAGLVGVLQRHPELENVLRREYIDGRRSNIIGAFERAKESGEMRSGVSIDLIWQVAPAIIFFRVLMAGDPIDTRTVERLVDEVVLPLCELNWLPDVSCQVPVRRSLEGTPSVSPMHRAGVNAAVRAPPPGAASGVA